MANIHEDLVAFNSRNNPFYNDKGYADPTAYQGIEAAATSEYLSLIHISEPTRRS